MKLELQRPLIVFDLETTGLNISTDRIVELCMIKIFPNNKQEIKHEYINPTIPIPLEITEIHGITDQQVKNSPTFKDIAKDLEKFIDDSDFAGFNSNKFDFPMLVQEFCRAEIDFAIENRKFIDAQRIFHAKEPRNLSAAYQFYCDKTLENAHSAKADTLATWEIIEAQIEKYDDLKPTVDFLNKLSGNSKLVDLAGRFIKNDAGNVLFNFGKFKGKKVLDILAKEKGYYEWMMRGEFPENTKRVLTRLYLGLKNQA